MHFRNLLAAATAAGAVMAVANSAAAANVTQTATATAAIVAPVSITKSADLNFGKVAVPTNGTTTVTLTSSATPNLSTSGGNGYVANPTGAAAAHFVLNGYTGDSFSSVSASLTSMSDGAGHNLTNVSAASPAVTSGVSGTGPYTLTANAADIYVGGQFDVTTTTVAATYSGTLTLTVAYP